MLRVARRTLRRWESPRLPGPQSRSAQQPASTGPPGTGGPPSLPRHPFRVTPTPLSYVGCWRVSTPERPAQVRASPMPLPHSPRSPAVADAQFPSLGRPGASRAAATAPALEAVARAERCAGLLGRVRRAAGRRRRADAGRCTPPGGRRRRRHAHRPDRGPVRHVGATRRPGLARQRHAHPRPGQQGASTAAPHDQQAGHWEWLTAHRAQAMSADEALPRALAALEAL
jgi:hypothetical protein